MLTRTEMEAMILLKKQREFEKKEKEEASLNEQIATVNEQTARYANDNSKIVIKVKRIDLGLSSIGGGSFSTTSRSIGSISTLFGLNLSHDHIISIWALQCSLSPASNLTFGAYDNNIYVAASQSTTLSSAGMHLLVTYWESV